MIEFFEDKPEVMNVIETSGAKPTSKCDAKAESACGISSAQIEFMNQLANAIQESFLEGELPPLKTHCKSNPSSTNV